MRKDTKVHSPGRPPKPVPGKLSYERFVDGMADIERRMNGLHGRMIMNEKTNPAAALIALDEWDTLNDKAAAMFEDVVAERGRFLSSGAAPRQREAAEVFDFMAESIPAAVAEWREQATLARRRIVGENADR